MAQPTPNSDAVVATVIPCFRVKRHILDVIAAIGPEVQRIYVVDDKCPEESGAHVLKCVSDPRVQVLFNEHNQGVGGATMIGYREALKDGAEAIVKLDGDGQMDAALIPRMVRPLFDGEADYVKGNRFFNIEETIAMPRLRLIGNIGLSFLSKLSTGYWDVFDPTNGFTAVHGKVAALLPLDKMSQGYFFETDMLFRLAILRAVVTDIPMRAIYGGERSNLSVAREFPRFLAGHAALLAKRMIYNYWLRNFSIASLEMVLGPLLMVLGVAYGGSYWYANALAGVATAPGVVVMSALLLLVGIQLLLAFLNYDMASVPRVPLHPRL